MNKQISQFQPILSRFRVISARCCVRISALWNSFENAIASFLVLFSLLLRGCTRIWVKLRDPKQSSLRKHPLLLALRSSLLGTFEPLCNSTQQPWTPAQSKTQPVAHNPERAIAILRLCLGVYTDRFILNTFFSLHSCVRLHNSYINILILIVFTRKGSWYTLYVLILRLTLRMRRWAVFPAKSSALKV